MQTIEASKALETIVASVAKQEMRKPGPMKIGQRIHQGDVYLCLVADDHKRGPLLGTKQIAVGTTVGSRHVVEGDVQVFAGVELPKDMKIASDVERSAYLGPVVVVGSEGTTLTHPEHAHHELCEGVYQVTYQIDMATRMRVQD